MPGDFLVQWARMSRGRYEETGPVESQLYGEKFCQVDAVQFSLSSKLAEIESASSFRRRFGESISSELAMLACLPDRSRQR